MNFDPVRVIRTLAGRGAAFVVVGMGAGLWNPSDWYTPDETRLADRVEAVTAQIEQLETERHQLDADLVSAATAADEGVRRTPSEGLGAGCRPSRLATHTGARPVSGISLGEMPARQKLGGVFVTTPDQALQ